MLVHLKKGCEKSCGDDTSALKLKLQLKNVSQIIYRGLYIVNFCNKINRIIYKYIINSYFKRIQAQTFYNVDCNLKRKEKKNYFWE